MEDSEAILHAAEDVVRLLQQHQVEAVGKRRLFSINPGSETFHPALGEGLQWFSQSWFYLGMLHVETTLDALQESPGRSAHAESIKIREALTPMTTALRMAGLREVFAGTTHLTGEALVACFHDGTRSIQDLLTERSFPEAKS